MARVKFARGTQRSYDLMHRKDENTVYFTIDSGNLYLGNKLIFEPNAIVGAELATGGTKGITFTRRSGATALTPFTVSLADYVTADELAAAISSAVGSLYVIKGSCDYEELPTSDVNNGDVWNITNSFTIPSGSNAGTYPAGTNVVAIVDPTTGTITWDPLGGSQDLSGLVQKPLTFTAGNLIKFDSNGDAEDSGYDVSDFKTKQDAVEDPDVSGGNSITFISSITQNENGVISPTKKGVRNASQAANGLMSAAHYIKLEGLPADAEKNVVVGAQAVRTPQNGIPTTVEIPIDSSSRKMMIQTKGVYNGSSNKFMLQSDVEDVLDDALGWDDFDNDSNI